MAEMRDGFSIICADDDATVRNAMEMILQLDFPEDEILTASNGDEIMQHVMSRPNMPKIVVTDMDYDSQEREGFSIIDRVYAFDPTIPCIVVSGSDLAKECAAIQVPFINKQSVEPPAIERVVEAIRQAKRAETEATKPKTFLIVEDQPDARNFLVTALRQKIPNAVILEAANYEGAVELLGANKVDILLTDMGYGINGKYEQQAGLTLLEHAHREDPDMGLIGMSFNVELADACRQLGAAFVDKDMEDGPFLDQVMHHIKEKSATLSASPQPAARPGLQ